jgi:hypothetical protein
MGEKYVAALFSTPPPIVDFSVKLQGYLDIIHFPRQVQLSDKCKSKIYKLQFWRQSQQWQCDVAHNTADLLHQRLLRHKDNGLSTGIRQLTWHQVDWILQEVAEGRG